jgi:integrase
MILRLLAEAKLYEPGLGWHTFRHTYGRLFIEQGGRFEELKESLGHKSIVTTEQTYGHFHTDRAAQLARMKIYGEAGPRLLR